MQQEKAVGSVRTWEFVVAAVFLAFGATVVWESRRLGAQWGSDGPQAGYFPFYIGSIICISSIVNLYSAAVRANRAPFVKWGQLKMILTVIIPSLIYVAFIANPWMSLGIYVASALFIAFFMRYLGKYGWAKIVAVSIGTVVVFFLMFEAWFKVPLPKGPLEAAFGYA
ncbi:MAG: tripartite tricarboxylate transporter TctB family protein [Burkholderiales bacterium]|nr:tripartite tricarboxylate transporter TctB family protein [Burkholderiales bacterium]